MPTGSRPIDWARDGGANGTRKRAEQLAAAIERDIMRARWPVGELIGTEPELIERFGVSRAVFREAVRILEHHRVVRMRSGPGGGLVVTAPDATALIRAALLYLDYQNVSVSDLFEARLSLEMQAVERAVRNLDEAGVARLREVLKAEEDSGRPGRHSHELHSVLAELSGNPALALFVNVLVSLTEWRMGTVTDTVQDASVQDEMVRKSRRAHRAIVEAIVAGDLSLALHRMRRHVEGIHRYLPIAESPDPPTVRPRTERDGRVDAPTPTH